MARPRTPAALKLVKGTAQPCRTNKKEPKPRRVIPSPPEHLSESAKVAWGKATVILDRMAVLTEADGIALEEVCETYAELIECRRILRESPEGRVYGSDTDNGIILRPNPIVVQIADASRRLGMWLTKFGMTPADRSRVSSVGEDDGAKDPWTQL
jgi:P27 family predicted phage terminase small subunit